MGVKPLMLFPPLAFAGLALAFWLGLGRDPEALPSVFIGKQAPSLAAGEAMAGLPVLTEASLRSGHVTVVNFWASWCPPCRAENPTLLALAKEGVVVVGIDMLDDPVKAAAYLAADGNPFAALLADPRGAVRIDWGVTAPPETFILRGDGRVAFKFIGPLVGDGYAQIFRPELDKALAEVK